jgi:hypothetical protein
VTHPLFNLCLPICVCFHLPLLTFWDGLSRNASYSIKSKGICFCMQIKNQLETTCNIRPFLGCIALYSYTEWWNSQTWTLNAISLKEDKGRCYQQLTTFLCFWGGKTNYGFFYFKKTLWNTPNSWPFVIDKLTSTKSNGSCCCLNCLKFSTFQVLTCWPAKTLLLLQTASSDLHPNNY